MRPIESKPRRPKLREYKMFATSIRSTSTPGVIVLEVARGATRRTFEKDGTFVAETRESQAAFWTNIGEHVVVCGAGDASNTICGEVIGIEQHGFRECLRVRIGAGELAIGTTKGHVLRAHRLTGVPVSKPVSKRRAA